MTTYTIVVSTQGSPPNHLPKNSSGLKKDDIIWLLGVFLAYVEDIITLRGMATSVNDFVGHVKYIPNSLFLLTKLVTTLFSKSVEYKIIFTITAL